MAVDKRSVVTTVLCAVAALGASAAVAELVPPPETAAPVHAKSAVPSGPASAPSRSQASKPQLTKPQPAKPQPSAAAPRPGSATAFTGALFTGGLDGDHFCTATVVRSPGKNLLITAGHCLLEGEQTRDGGAVFAPAYANGVAPYGVWKIERVYEDKRWADDTDDDYDLAFARVAPDDKGRNIEDLTGGAPLDTSGRAGEEVTVTGYPADRKVPRTCTAVAVRTSEREQRFDCADFPGGTSGSAWLGRDGKIIGILTGGDTDDVSTSTVLGDYAAQLYAQATKR
ncbi:trypsin-like peptidase domain-containing protein [Streptomyces sp. NPDC001546]|uniref:trypsin-like serine peptidase n=1 Tax=Streptomyces sp. NPDC001546 TaxID=3364585 RepID=UPI003673E87A